MSEEVQGKLFTPFLQADSSMTRKHGGSGLGLAITQSLARMMDGDVTMMSNLNRGSEFTLTVKGQRSEGSQILDDVEALMDSVPEEPLETNALESAETHALETAPIAQPKTPEYAPIQAVKTSDIDIAINAASPTASETELVLTSKSEYNAETLRGLDVLIVDDIRANHDVIKLFLTPEGCKSHAALNGIEALEVLEAQAIDVIVMDIRMPEMDGIEATTAIRNSNRHYKNIPIIALTADVSAETNAACMAAGADIFLTKPVTGRDLIESIKFIRRFQDYEEETAAHVA
jgi:CheY-like chemotaxis protein